MDPTGLADSIEPFKNPAICILGSTGLTLQSVDTCNTIVQTAWQDKCYMRNNDYDRMCPNAQPTGCSEACLTQEFYDNIEKYCKPRIKTSKPK